MKRGMIHGLPPLALNGHGPGVDTLSSQQSGVGWGTVITAKARVEGGGGGKGEVSSQQWRGGG